MPVQTTKKGNIYFPDGAKAQVKASGDSSYTDLGALNSAIGITLNYTENQLSTANAGKTDPQIRDMEIEGSFTLINFDLAAVEKMGGGIFERAQTAGTAVTTSPDQDIAAGWSDNTLYDLDIQTSSSDSTPLRASAKPTLTSVTLDPDGTPEVLTENNDYVVQENSNSTSGWSIQFISAGMVVGSPTTFPIRIDYSSVTPYATTNMYVGTSTKILTPYALKFTHTDSNSKIREVEIFSVSPTSGGFQFNFKGANEDGVEEMPITFNGDIDTSLTDGRQLIRWTVDDNAL